VSATTSPLLLHTFGNDQNGSAPDGGVVLDKPGNVYGTTAYGGGGGGVTYKLTNKSSGKFRYTVLRVFGTGCPTGAPEGA